MRLTLCELDIRSLSESDYDTAVDLAHYQEQRVRYVLQLPSGACLALEQTSSCTTYSYLEPDFDLLEAGGELRYEQHASGEAPRESTDYFFEVEPLFQMRAITVDEWARLLQESYGEDFDVTMFLESEEVDVHAGPVPLEWAALFAAVEAQNLREGQSFDAAVLGAEFLRWAQAVDDQGWQLNGHNLQARIDSRCSQALHRLQGWLAQWQPTPAA